MTDIFLYQGEAAPSDIRLRDPLTAEIQTVISGGGAWLPGRRRDPMATEMIRRMLMDARDSRQREELLAEIDEEDMSIFTATH